MGVAAAAVVLGSLVAPTAAGAAAPNGLTPDDVVTPRKNIELSWIDTGASAYVVQIANRDGKYEDSTHGGPAVEATVKIPRFTVPSTLPVGIYRWRVREAGSSDWSASARFWHDWADAPTNVRQVPGREDQQGPMLTWDAIPDASFYEVQLSTVPFDGDQEDAGRPLDPDDEEGSRCYTQATVLTPYSTVKGDDEGITDDTLFKCVEIQAPGVPVYWRVRGRDGAMDQTATAAKPYADQCTGPWYDKNSTESAQAAECSDWGYPTDGPFVMPAVPTSDDAADPFSARPPAPTNPAVGPLRNTPGPNQTARISNLPVFTWDPVPGAAFYRVIRSQGDPTLTNQDHVYETTATALSPVKDYGESLEPTFWSVQACIIDTVGSDGFVLQYDDNDTHVKCSPRTAVQKYVVEYDQNVQRTDQRTEGPATVLEWSTNLSTAKASPGLQVNATEVRGYEVQVFAEGGRPWRTFAVDRVGTTANRSRLALPTADLPAGWSWRVRGVDESGNRLGWSSTSAPAPVPPAPPAATFATSDGAGPTDALRVRFTQPVTGVTNATLGVNAKGLGAVAGTTVRKVNDRVYDVRPPGAWTFGETYTIRVAPAVKSQSSGLSATASSAGVRVARNADSASPGLTRKTGDKPWRTVRSSSAIGKSYLMTKPKKKTKNPSYVQARVRGSSVTVHACLTPSSGKARVVVDGRTARTVDLYRRATKCGAVATVALSPSTAHVVRFEPTGTKRKKSKGRTVRFDGLAVR